jgi:hypothetical protein
MARADLVEAGQVGAVDVVDRAVLTSAPLGALLVDALHDLAQATVHLVPGPRDVPLPPVPTPETIAPC